MNPRTAVSSWLALLAGFLMTLIGVNSGSYPGPVFESGAPVLAPEIQTTEVPKGSFSVSTRTGAANYSYPIIVPPGRQGMQPTLTLNYSSQNPVRGGLAAGWQFEVPSIRVDTSTGRLAGTQYLSTLAGGQRLVPVNEPAQSEGVQTFRAEQDASYTRYQKVQIAPAEDPASSGIDHPNSGEASLPGTPSADPASSGIGHPDSGEAALPETPSADPVSSGIDHPDSGEAALPETPSAEFFWRALRPDGTTYIFGEAPARDTPDSETGATEARWFVTRIFDRFGNQVVFQYQRVLGEARNRELRDIPIDIVLAAIDYTSNASAGLISHARIEFEYAPQLDLCPGSAVPIGAQFSYRTGIRIYEGARRLDRITTSVRQTPDSPLQVRRIVELSYDQRELDCGATGQGLHAPLRLLTGIRERGFNLAGEETALPATTFGYGMLEHNFSQVTSIPALAATEGDVGSGKEPLNVTKAGGWPTIDELLMDFNGDAAPDLLRSRELQTPERDVFCSVQWQRNVAGGALDQGKILALPSVPWANATPESPAGFRNDGAASNHLLESCSLSYQFTRRSNKPSGDAIDERCRGMPSNYLSYRFLDLDGDGDLDLATALDYKRGRYSPNSDSVLEGVNLHGDTPACPARPYCRSPTGAAVACRTRNNIGIFFILRGDNPSPNSGFPEPCPVNQCRSPFCVPDIPGDPGPTFPDPAPPDGDSGSDSPFVGGNCSCSIDNCLTSDKVGQWDPPSIPDDWSGPPFVPGDAGGEERPSRSANQWCEQVPEMSCALGHGISELDRESRFMYVWRVHWNVGDGVFPHEPTEPLTPAEQPSETSTLLSREVFTLDPEIHLSPLPLETDRPVSPTGNEPASSWTGVLDIDGDGLLDAIWQDPIGVETIEGPTGWPGRIHTGRFLVFRGDGKGNFLPKKNGEPYEWREPHVFVRSRVSLDRVGYNNRRTNGELHRSTDTLVTLEDINGDGLPDLIDSRDFSNSEDLDDRPFGLRVFFNTGTGFEPKPTILSGALPTLSRRIQIVLNKHPNEQTRNGWSVFERRPIDLDQDGLLDFVSIAPPSEGQSNPWVVPGAPAFSIFSPAEHPSSSSVAAPAETPSASPISSIEHPNTGEAALPGTPTVAAYFNVGDQLVRNGDQATLNSWRPGLARIQLAVDEFGNRGVWKIKTDLMDFDGDGLADLFNNDNLDPTSHCRPTDAGAIAGLCGRSSEVLVDGGTDGSPERAQGFRLLASVSTGQGATIRFNYAPGTDTSVVETAAERGRKNPRTMWVVNSLRVDLEHGPSSATTYRYRFPVLNRDRHGQFGFRGFEEVSIRHPENAQGVRRTTVERYDFDLDFSGLMVERVVHSGDTVSRIESTIWQKMGLFRGSVVAFHPKEMQTRICDSTNNQEEGSCRNHGSLRREVKGWAPVLMSVDPRPSPTFETVANAENSSGGSSDLGDPSLPEDMDQPAHQPERDKLCSSMASGGADSRAVLFVQCGERLTDRLGGVVLGDRGGLHDYKVLYDDLAYLVLKTEERRIVALGNGSTTSWGPVKTRGRERTVYDGEGRGLPLESHTLLDESTEATTRRTFDPLTGNVKTIQRPNQVAADSSLKTILDYEPFGIYSGSVINEAGHKVATTTDLAVGKTVLTEGPEQPGVGVPGLRRVLDGLGRVREQFRSVEAPEGGLAEKLYSRTQYFDEERPARIRTEDVIEYDHPRLVVTDRTYDGLSRLLSEEVKTASGSAVRRYGYDSAGNLVSISVPNPRDESPDAVYNYEYDAERRLTRWVPPIGSPSVIKYDGMSTFRTETPTDASVPKPVKLTHDVFGRLTSVVEKSIGGDAITTYAYDSNDNLERIEDADGVVTLLKHDNGNRRVAITRGTRIWEYRYDFEGNRIAEVSPHLAGDEIEAFTTHYTYDELGRLESRLPGRRNLTADQMKRYGFGPTFLRYDTPTHRNAVGRLARVDLPFGAIEYDYSVQGWPVKELRRFEINPFDRVPIVDERTVITEYNALGLSMRETHADGSVSKTNYDERGLPIKSSVEIAPAPTAEDLLLADLTRKRNGVPTSRTAFNQRQEWEFDSRGRVVDHRILVDTATVAGEVLVYDDVGNTKSLKSRVTDFALDFEYDSQHQLSIAHGSIPGIYDGVYRYSPAGRVLGVQVESLNRNTDILPRNVVHDYAGNLSTGVRKLLPADGSSTPLAVYEYDESGNVIRRRIGDETWNLTYDGYGEMREAAFVPIGGPPVREIYFYDHSGSRMLAARESFGNEPASARLWIGDTEVRYGEDGRAQGTELDVSLGALPVARIVDGNVRKPELIYQGELRNLVAVLGKSGEIIARFSYGPYGELLTIEGTGSASYPRRFNYKQLDRVTKLLYYGYRYYDSVSLDWIQTDPLYRYSLDLAYDEPGRLNLYSFALRNPLRMLDPDGRDPNETQVPFDPTTETRPIIFRTISVNNLVFKAAHSSVRTMGEAPNSSVRSEGYAGWTNRSFNVFLDPAAFQSTVTYAYVGSHELTHVLQFLKNGNKLPTYKEMIRWEIEAYGGGVNLLDKLIKSNAEFTPYELTELVVAFEGTKKALAQLKEMSKCDSETACKEELVTKEFLPEHDELDDLYEPDDHDEPSDDKSPNE